MDRYFLVRIFFFIFFPLVLRGAFIPQEKGIYAVVQTNLGDFVIKLHRSETPLAVSNFVELTQGTRPFWDITKSEFVTRAFYNGLKFYEAVKEGYIASGCQENTGRMSVIVGYTFVDECYRKGAEIDGLITSEYEAATVWANLLHPYFSSKKGNGSSHFLNDLCKQILKNGTYAPLYKMDIALIREELKGNRKKVYKRELIFPVVYGSVCMFNKGTVNNNGSRFLIVTAKSGLPILNGSATVFGKVILGMDVVHKIEEGVLLSEQKKLSVGRNPEILSIFIKKLE